MKRQVKGFVLIVSVVSITFLIAYFKVYDQRISPSSSLRDNSDVVLPLQNNTQALISGHLEIAPNIDYAAVDIAWLDSKMAAYFATANLQSRTLDTVPPINIEQMLDRQRAYEFIEIRYWLGLAIDLGMNLDGLSKFGVEAIEEGKYSIDLKKYPEWIMYRNTFTSFQNGEMFKDLVTPTLLSMGFSEDNLNALKSYLNAHNPRLDSKIALLPVLDAEYAKTKSLQLDPQQDKNTYRSLAFELNYSAFRATSRIWTEWSLNLFEQLDRDGQEILASFIRKRVKSTTLIPSSIENIEEKYIEEIASERLRNEIQNSIHSFQERSTHIN